MTLQLATSRSPAAAQSDYIKSRRVNDKGVHIRGLVPGGKLNLKSIEPQIKLRLI
jgi:hypothetical protein